MQRHGSRGCVRDLMAPWSYPVDRRPLQWAASSSSPASTPSVQRRDSPAALRSPDAMGGCGGFAANRAGGDQERSKAAQIFPTDVAGTLRRAAENLFGGAERSGGPERIFLEVRSAPEVRN